jgi:VWFA-related protein
MERAKRVMAACLVFCASAMMAQNNNGGVTDSGTTLKVNSRAVLVDVIVTDRNGNPVKGLKQDDFRLLEQAKPQSITYFEEHSSEDLANRSQKMEFPALPPNVFSNYSPLPTPPAVNVLLLDALNTPMSDQMYLKQAAKHYLKTLKPGTRLAIFTMSMRLSYIQGFSDDPAVLATAMGYRKNDKSEPAVLLQSQGESDAQNTVVAMMVAAEQAGSNANVFTVPPQAIEAFQQFMQETRYAQDSDREYITLQNLNQLAAFLGSFPGRKNVIWMSGAFPLELFGQTAMRFDDSIAQTINLLSAARVAIYPVDVRGTNVPQYYTAENSLDPTITTAPQLLGAPPGVAGDAPNKSNGGFAGGLADESAAKNSSDSTMDMLATETGGKAFYNQNDLSRIIGKVMGSSEDFYTLSYTPTNSMMDGGFRNIEVKVGDGNQYRLSYRRGYVARDEDLPGAAQSRQDQAAQQSSKNPTVLDPLEPFMTFGMPQSEQILYKAQVKHVASGEDRPVATHVNFQGPAERYSVDFAVDLNDLSLKPAADGLHKGKLNLSLIVYDRYGQVSSRADHLVDLNIKPHIWAIMQQRGLQLHGEIEAPKGQYWLRTGIYDESSHKVGTMEIPLSSVRDNLASK